MNKYVDILNEAKREATMRLIGEVESFTRISAGIIRDDQKGVIALLEDKA